MLRSLLALLIALVTGTTTAGAQSISFESPEQRFHFTYPPNFELVPLHHPYVAVSLRDKENGYPTFNVVIEPGEYEIGTQVMDQLKDDLLGSYRKIGLNDAQLSNPRVIQLSGRPAFQAEVHFTDQNGQLISSVTVISGTTRHYTLTYLDRAAEFAQRVQYADQILANFVVTEPLPGGREARDHVQPVWLLLGLAVLGAVGFFAWHLYRKRR